MRRRWWRYPFLSQPLLLFRNGVARSLLPGPHKPEPTRRNRMRYRLPWSLSPRFSCLPCRRCFARIRVPQRLLSRRIRPARNRFLLPNRRQHPQPSRKQSKTVRPPGRHLWKHRSRSPQLQPPSPSQRRNPMETPPQRGKFCSKSCRTFRKKRERRFKARCGSPCVCG